ncbi:transmembrane protein 26 [Arctopsyche grandis]|uniref:transmembrane protein 26 n=1 Tax=Arctopsyche grandis TaxID=121162 RepID=UPI00406D79ED
MAKLLATIKAIITRVVFASHGIIAIWQVTIFKRNLHYWYLALPTLLLFAEGIFTLTIKDNQEWKWFCPSVFIYLGSVVPAIWLLELHKVDKRIQAREEHYNLTAVTGVDLKDLNKILGGKVHLPDIPFSTETWVTLIEQFLMLTLIVGRWLLPKGDLTRDQLSQLLLVYIGTAADIIEFFDSFKDEKIISEPLLVILTLAIWSWSLLQFTVVLTATKSRKSRVSSNGSFMNGVTTETCCCTIDVCAIFMNIALQDAPFLTFRLLIIIHYGIVSYMNVFFTCKNTLVILLQIYRLYVVHSETNKSKNKKLTKRGESKAVAGTSKGGKKKHAKSKKTKRTKNFKMSDMEVGNIAIITNPADIHKLNANKNIKLRAFIVKNKETLKELDLIKFWRENETISAADDDNDCDGNKRSKHSKSHKKSSQSKGKAKCDDDLSSKRSEKKKSEKSSAKRRPRDESDDDEDLETVEVETTKQTKSSKPTSSRHHDTSDSGSINEDNDDDDDEVYHRKRPTGNGSDSYSSE